MVHSDVFILFDDVQFPRGKTFGNRVLIKTPNGESWLTIPVQGKGDLLLFNQIEISDLTWLKKAIRTIQVCYSKAPHYKEVFPGLEDIFSRRFQRLYELNISLIEYLVKILGIKTIITSSSAIKTDTNDQPPGKIIDLILSVGANQYISGKGEGSKRYLDENVFREKRIKLIWQDFQHPEYKQLYGEFIPNLSIIDMVFMEGPEKTLEILKNIRISSQ